jgi:hypothetical protein
MKARDASGAEIVLVERDAQELSIAERSCEVVLEDDLPFLVRVVKGDAGVSIFRLNVPVEVPRLRATSLLLADSGALGVQWKPRWRG